MSSSSDNIFWIKQPSVLFCGNNFFNLVPNSAQNLASNLNSLTRACILLLIIFLIVPQTRKYWYLPIILILIIVIYYFYSRKKENKTDKEDFVEQIIVDRSNINSDLDLDLEIENEYVPNQKIFKPAKFIESRLMEKNSHQKLADDTDTFAKWVYSTPETCKENSANCYQYEDLRFNRN